MASRTPALRGWLVVLVLGVLAGLWGVALLVGGGAGKHTPTDPARTPAGPTTGPTTGSTTGPVARRPAGVELLHRWDRARAKAWARGSPAALRTLYVAGSSAGAADLALLERYRDRGLVVSGMRRQVLAVQVLEGDSGLCRLRVTDRLVGAVARATDDPRSAGRALPTSRAVTRTVLLRRTDDRWRMVSVRIDHHRGS